MVKKSHERWNTYQQVFDEHTLRNIFKLSSQGHFAALESTIAIGKEAKIFSAKRDASSESQDNVIVKIYLLETFDFNKMYEYIRYDPRYVSLKRQRRKIIFAWCQREFRNLLKLRESGIRVPKPITFVDNLLVMEQINSEEGIAPKLKDSHIENPTEFFNKLALSMKKMYNDAGLVHGDLSSFNILNKDQEPVIIDVSQSIPVDTITANELLKRDIRNVVNFFKKQGVDTSEEILYKYITGENYPIV
jgi:RIO kinase 1